MKTKGVVKWMWIAAAALLVSAIAFFTILSFSNLPTFEDLENPQQSEASEIYFEDGVTTMGRWALENRVKIDYDDINPHLINALIATEDKRFYRHSGIDAEALGRVAVKTVLLRNADSGGGSTITQQLAKLLYNRPSTRGMNFIRRYSILVITKLKEWITAVKLERAYTKEEILAMYLNHFDFLYNSYGIQSASETYFAKDQKDLNIEEAAILVGMLKNPGLYNPTRFPENAKNRRMVVLNQMRKADYINQAAYDSLKVLPIEMGDFARKNHTTGPATYFRMELRKHVREILRRSDTPKKRDGSTYNIDEDGLRVFTTIDENMQAHAEAAVGNHMPKLQRTFFRHWNLIKENPWEYEEDESNVDIKLANLKAHVRRSRRYQSMRKKDLVPYIKEVEKVYDINLSDADILRMLEVEQDRSALDRYLEVPLISKADGKKYIEIIEGPDWQQLKKDWNSFQKLVTQVFDTPVKMRVFSYESSTFEVDTTMSPLDTIKHHRKHLQTGFLAMDPRSGALRAWVGGTNIKWFQLDHIYTNRQIGSTFKPFIYATAIARQGISPCREYDDIQYSISQGEGNFHLQSNWAPKNSNNEYELDPINLYDGFRLSKNTITVALLKEIASVQPVVDLAVAMGVDRDKILPVPSIGLGTPDLTVIEMIGAYGAFANNGYHNKPFFIKRIEDKNGRELYRSVQEEKRVLQSGPNYVMVDLMKNAAQGAKNSMALRSEIGGKTGTTQNHSDGWFMGITPSVVVGIWVGGDDPWMRFRTLDLGSGARMARPMFLDFIKRLEEDPEANYDTDARFFIPENLNITIDCEKYKDLNQDPEAEDEGDEADDFF